MKFLQSSLLFAVLTPFTTAATEAKQVIVSYPQDTPLSILEEAKDAIIKAGGVITHEFNLIKGFTANAPAKILESLQALESHSNILIEEDKVVTANDA